MTAQTQEAPAIKFSPRRVGHANLFVGELERSMEFYNKVAGFEEVYRIHIVNAGFLSNGNTHHDLGLVQVSDKVLVGRDGKPVPSSGRAKKAGLNHFGWEMDNEQRLVEAYDRAVEAGYPIYRCVDHQSAHSVYVFDPDGNEHEIYADMIRDWRGFFDSQKGSPVTGSWEPHAAPATAESRYDAGAEIRRVDDALVHSLRFTHAVLMCGKFGPMVDFYEGVAGLSNVYSAPDGAFQCFAGSAAGYAFSIALFSQAEGAAPSIHHYSYEVANECELDSAEKALADAGVEIEMRVDNPVKRSLFVKDPDAMRCEFYVARAPDFSAVAGADHKQRPYLI